MFNNFLSSENHAVYEITRKHIVDPDRPQTTTLRMRIACWITNVTNTRLEYVMFIAFPLQQWLHERALALYLHCLSCYITFTFPRALLFWSLKRIRSGPKYCVLFCNTLGVPVIL